MARPRRGPWAAVLVPLVTLAPAIPASAGGQAPEGERFSDGRTAAQWAHPQQMVTARRRPADTAPRVARIHARTEDGFPEVYPVLKRFADDAGHIWFRIRIPMRPQARTGWVRDSALGPLYRVRTRLVVDRRRLRATLYRSGRRIWRSRIGVGKRGTPTPAGQFWIREKFRVDNPGGLYGPRAFGTSAYSRLSDWPGGGVIGIHGTNQPHLLPGRPSHGCIRVPNRAITRLYRLMPIGTPVLVL